MAINKRIIRSNDEGGVGASFNTVTWIGALGSTQQVTGVGFEPEMIWLKNRDADASGGSNHHIMDIVRGVDNFLYPNLTIAETLNTGAIESVDPNGFTVSNSTRFNNTGKDYVAWCWKAGGAAVVNNDGTITSQVSANTEAGFSIVSYTGNGQNNVSIGHGLNSTPSIVITKSRDLARDWHIFGTLLGQDNYLLFTTTALLTAGTYFPLPNINTINYGTNTDSLNGNGSQYISYCFAEVAGFSKFGSYVAPFDSPINIDCGFEPAFVMTKAVSNLTSGFESYRSWGIYDNKRNMTGNTTTNPLWANQSFAEGTRGNGDVQPDVLNLTFEPTGFSIPVSSVESNGFEGETYIYMAFANQF